MASTRLGDHGGALGLKSGQNPNVLAPSAQAEVAAWKAKYASLRRENEELRDELNASKNELQKAQEYIEELEATMREQEAAALEFRDALKEYLQWSDSRASTDVREHRFKRDAPSMSTALTALPSRSYASPLALLQHRYELHRASMASSAAGAPRGPETDEEARLAAEEDAKLAELGPKLGDMGYTIAALARERRNRQLARGLSQGSGAAAASLPADDNTPSSFRHATPFSERMRRHQTMWSRFPDSSNGMSHTTSSKRSPDQNERVPLSSLHPLAATTQSDSGSIDRHPSMASPFISTIMPQGAGMWRSPAANGVRHSKTSMSTPPAAQSEQPTAFTAAAKPDLAAEDNDPGCSSPQVCVSPGIRASSPVAAQAPFSPPVITPQDTRATAPIANKHSHPEPSSPAPSPSTSTRYSKTATLPAENGSDTASSSDILRETPSDALHETPSAAPAVGLANPAVPAASAFSTTQTNNSLPALDPVTVTPAHRSRSIDRFASTGVSVNDLLCETSTDRSHNKAQDASISDPINRAVTMPSPAGSAFTPRGAPTGLPAPPQQSPGSSSMGARSASVSSLSALSPEHDIPLVDAAASRASAVPKLNMKKLAASPRSGGASAVRSSAAAADSARGRSARGARASQLSSRASASATSVSSSSGTLPGRGALPGATPRGGGFSQRLTREREARNGSRDGAFGAAALRRTSVRRSAELFESRSFEARQSKSSDAVKEQRRLAALMAQEAAAEVKSRSTVLSRGSVDASADGVRNSLVSQKSAMGPVLASLEAMPDPDYNSGVLLDEEEDIPSPPELPECVSQRIAMFEDVSASQGSGRLPLPANIQPSSSFALPSRKPAPSALPHMSPSKPATAPAVVPTLSAMNGGCSDMPLPVVALHNHLHVMSRLCVDDDEAACGQNSDCDVMHGSRRESLEASGPLDVATTA